MFLLGLMPNNIPISMFLGGLRPDKIPTSVFLGGPRPDKIPIPAFLRGLKARSNSHPLAGSYGGLNNENYHKRVPRGAQTK